MHASFVSYAVLVESDDGRSEGSWCPGDVGAVSVIAWRRCHLASVTGFPDPGKADELFTCRCRLSLLSLGKYKRTVAGDLAMAGNMAGERHAPTSCDNSGLRPGGASRKVQPARAAIGRRRCPCRLLGFSEVAVPDGRQDASIPARRGEVDGRSTIPKNDRIGQS